jgi:hypothetical protein
MAHIESSPGCCISSQSSKNPFTSARKLKAATSFCGKKCTVILRLREAGLRAQHSAVKDVLTNEHKFFHVACAENNVDCKCDRDILSDESTFSSSNDGLILL